MTPGRSPNRRAVGRIARLLLTALACVFTLAARAEEVTIFAAASTADAVEEIATLLESREAIALRPVFAASSTLAKQIAAGAPADLFLSASSLWMDYLSQGGAIDARSRVDLLGNRLVLIAPADSGLALAIAPNFALAAALGDRRLALGDPGHVPAGIYAKTALEALGVWPEVADKTALAGNVRGALVLVERGEAAAGVVYASDARISRRVRVVDRFPPDSHPPIVYPLAIVAGRRTPAVARVHAFFRGAEAATVFRARGFRPLGPEE